MELEISGLAPADLSSTCRRQVCQATGTDDYAQATGDLVTPEQVRMGKLFAILGNVFAFAAGVGYVGFFTPDNVGDGTGVPAVFWYNAATGAQAVDGTDLSSSGSMTVEAVGQ